MDAFGLWRQGKANGRSICVTAEKGKGNKHQPFSESHLKREKHGVAERQKPLGMKRSRKQHVP